MQKMNQVVVVALLAVGCSGSGQLKASLTDKPTDLANVKSVLVTIDSVRVHSDAAGSWDAGTADGGAVTDDDGTNGSGWIELCESSAGETFDLMTLTNGRTAPLCDGHTLTVPAGKISQARLHVIAAKLVFNDDTEYTLTVPSGSTSGLKVNVNEEVPSGGTLELKFDFVASDSITAEGSGSYSLKPVIKVSK